MHTNTTKVIVAAHPNIATWCPPVVSAGTKYQCSADVSGSNFTLSPTRDNEDNEVTELGGKAFIDNPYFSMPVFLDF